MSASKIITQKDLKGVLDSKMPKNSNLVNGSATGSLRTKNSATESSSYTIGTYAFAEGYNSKASGSCSHAEGSGTLASGINSHAEGNNTTASGDYSHAGGFNTIAQRKSQVVIGRYNIADTEGSNTASYGKYAYIIGRGDSSTRSNAYAVTWYGDVEVYLDQNGSSSADATSGDDKDLFNAIRALGWYSDVIV